MNTHRVDPFALVGAVLAVLMAVGYVAVMQQQGEERPLAWVLVTLLVGAALAGYGAMTGAAHRSPALIVAGVLLVALGILAILSIGLPIILAGGLCLVAATRGTRAATPGHGDPVE